MKKRSFLGVIILILVALLVPSSVVKADTPFDFICDDLAVNGETIKCELKYMASTTGTIKSIKGSVELGSNFTIERFEANSLFDNQSSNKENLTFQHTSSDGVPVTETLVTVYLKTTMSDAAKSTDQVKLLISTVDGTINSETNIKLSSNVIKLERKDENRLSSLSVSSGTLKPSFSSDVLEYNLITDEEELTLIPTTKDKQAKYEIENSTGNKVALEYGENIVSIKVIAQDGSVKTYKLIVTRKDNRNDNAKLQLLSVDGKKIALKDGNYNYTIDVPYDTEDANLLYAASSSTSTVEVTGNEKLVIGENRITLTVTSEKGTGGVGSVVVQLVTINRLNEIKSDDSSIKRLEILNVDNLDFDFKSDNHNYMIKLPNKVKQLEFKIELNDEKATYEVTGNENLEDYSKVLIKVTAEDGSTTTYSFLIEKKASNNSLLPVLIILILILIALIAAIVFVIMKNRKNKDNNKNDKNNKETKETNATSDDKKSKLIDNITLTEMPKKDENNMMIFTDPDEPKKEEPVVIEEKEETIDEEKEDTKEFVIRRSEPLENPEFEDDKIKLENPEFVEKDINNEENPNFE